MTICQIHMYLSDKYLVAIRKQRSEQKTVISHIAERVVAETGVQ